MLEYVEKWTIFSQFANYFTQIEGIGAGKFAKVFSVRREIDQKKFAVKVYDSKKILSENHMFWILNEIIILKRINNELNTNCLKLFRVYEGLNYIYCVMELYNGGELLDAMIYEDSLSEYIVLKIIRNLLIALEFLEKQSIVHRDIKPQNIVLWNKQDIYDIVLVDFGFAINCSEVTLMQKEKGYCVGTPGYIAPEMLCHELYDCRADVFSAGATLYI